MDRNPPIGSVQQRLFPVEEAKVIKHRERKIYGTLLTRRFASSMIGIRVRRIAIKSLTIAAEVHGF